MEVFVLSFLIFVLAALGLAVGTLVRGSVLKGSCGGLGAAAGVTDGCGFCQPSCNTQEIAQRLPDNTSEPIRTASDTERIAGTVRTP